MNDNESLNFIFNWEKQFNEDFPITFNENLGKYSTQNTLNPDFEEEIKKKIFKQDNKDNIIIENEENIIDNNNKEKLIDNQSDKNFQNYIKRKRNPKQKEDIPRKDNIFKQVKLQAIKFIINTLNKLLNHPIYIFSNNIKKKLKDRVMKDYNIKILNESIENLLTNNHYCFDDNNKIIINFFENIYKKNKDDKNLKLINNFLKKKLIEIIEIFGMNEELFEMEYGFKNEYLLEQNHKIINKYYLKNLINFGVIEFIKSKKGRNIKSNKT